MIFNPFLVIETKSSRGPLRPIHLKSSFGSVKSSANVKLPFGKNPSLPVLFSTPTGIFSLGSRGIRPFSKTGNVPPVHRQHKSLTTCIYTLFFVGTNSQKYTIILTIRTINQVGMSGPINFVASVVRKIPLRKYWIAWSRFERTFWDYR